jgi:hypothetical protein
VCSTHPYILFLFYKSNDFFPVDVFFVPFMVCAFLIPSELAFEILEE